MWERNDPDEAYQYWPLNGFRNLITCRVYRASPLFGLRGMMQDATRQNYRFLIFFKFFAELLATKSCETNNFLMSPVFTRTIGNIFSSSIC